MSWLVPSALVITGVAVVALVAVHFIARSRPLAEPLPTARFIPERAVRARTRSIALSDLWLLLLRGAAIAAIGAAVAGPVFASARGRVMRVIVADRSRAVAKITEVRDSVRALTRSGDVVVVFDSVAAPRTRFMDSLVATAARGSLSAGLAAAIRAGTSLAPRSDSLELVIVSPFVREELDAATPRLRDAWAGRARLVRVRAAAVTPSSPHVAIPTDTDDVVAAGLALAGFVAPPGQPDATVRIVRGEMSANDSAWASVQGHVLVHWPATASNATWPGRKTIDAIGGVASASGTLVGRFPRLWVLNGGVAVARWADGEPAAVEHAMGGGCIRDVSVLVDQSSDLTLRSPFREFVRALVAPCGGETDRTPLDSAALATLAGSGALAPAAPLRIDASEASPWTPWLIALAALLLIVELAVRRGPVQAT